ncbi:MAG: HDOD domain-containing protein [Methylococcaceae bacterium]|nr:HDOD domain-containing protein [Methylococcaceae bacterium]MCI0733399.1 HDOD domain-containing protein [Methylococcaceae bacterium]
MNEASTASKFPVPPETKPQGHRSIEEWVEWLSKQKMPIFSHTARQIHKSMDNKQVGAPELSKIILQDPTLTARILKLSNSPYYNPAGLKIHTISRGIVILGYQTIREIALTCSFIETFVSISSKPQVNQKIAHALHAAIQAKSLAILNNDPCPEEVFIAALLSDLGQISFACFDKEFSPRIETLSAEKQIPVEQAEREILGFTLNELGTSLSRSWNLKGLLDPDPSAGEKNLKRGELVQLSHSIARAMESESNAEGLDQKLSKIAGQVQKPVASLLSIVRQNREKFFKMAIQFGARDFQKPAMKRAGGQSSSVAPERQTAKPGDPGLQLKILQDISNLLTTTINLNLVFETVMEGIHRAAGMDRTLFVVLTPDRRELKEKSTLGWPIGENIPPIRISITEPNNLFSHAIRQPEALWLKPECDSRIAALYSRQIVDQIGKFECFAARLALNGKPIGLLYADRMPDKNPLTQQNFESFSLFARQANIALALSRSSPG